MFAHSAYCINPSLSVRAGGLPASRIARHRQPTRLRTASQSRRVVGRLRRRGSSQGPAARRSPFWATHQGAELDLLLFKHGRRIGIELKGFMLTVSRENKLWEIHRRPGQTQSPPGWNSWRTTGCHPCKSRELRSCRQRTSRPANPTPDYLCP